MKFTGLKSLVRRMLPSVQQKKLTLPMLLQPFLYNTSYDVLKTTDFGQQVEQFKSWVYVCASKNANAIAALPLRVYAYRTKKSQKYAVKTVPVPLERKQYLYKQPHLANILSKAVDFEEVLEHPMLDLFKQVNPFMSRYDLWEQTMLWLEVNGNAYWYLASAQKPSEKTQPDQIWVLPANKMQIVPDPDKYIKGYIYNNGTMKIPYDVNEIIHFKYPALDNPYYGMSPLVAVAFSVSINNSINTFERALMDNMARPEGTLTTEMSLDDEEFERLKSDWSANYGGAAKVGKTVILEKGLKYEPITFSPRELQYIQGRKWNREEICAAYGVPLSKVTTEQINLANADAGERQYMADTIQPKATRIQEKLNEDFFIGRYGTNIFVQFDNPVPEDKDFLLRERESNLRVYMTSINEERSKLGLEDVEWGDRPLVGAGIAPLPTEEERKAQAEQMQQQMQPKEEQQPPAEEEGTPKEEAAAEGDDKETLEALAAEMGKLFNGLSDSIVDKWRKEKNNVLPMRRKRA